LLLTKASGASFAALKDVGFLLLDLQVQAQLCLLPSPAMKCWVL